MSEGPLVAIDPGSAKCGIAVLSADGEVLQREIVAAETIGETVQAVAEAHQASQIVVGGGTGSQAVLERIVACGASTEVTQAPEGYTTLEARGRYWQEHRPGCLLGLLPAGMRIPPQAIDDYAAVVIAERFLAGKTSHR